MRRKHDWWKSVALVCLLLTVGLLVIGCELNDKQKPISRGMEKLLQEKIAALPAEEQAQVNRYFDSLPAEKKDALAERVVNHLKKQSLNQSKHGSGQAHKKNKGKSQLKTRHQGREKIQRRKMARRSPDREKEKLQTLKKRLMRLPPEKRHQSFKKLRQKNPELARQLAQQHRSRKPDRMQRRQGHKKGHQKQMTRRSQKKHCSDRRGQEHRSLDRRHHQAKRSDGLPPGIKAGLHAFIEHATREDIDMFRQLIRQRIGGHQKKNWNKKHKKFRHQKEKKKSGGHRGQKKHNKNMNWEDYWG